MDSYRFNKLWRIWWSKFHGPWCLALEPSTPTHFSNCWLRFFYRTILRWPCPTTFPQCHSKTADGSLQLGVFVANLLHLKGVEAPTTQVWSCMQPLDELRTMRPCAPPSVPCNAWRRKMGRRRQGLTCWWLQCPVGGTAWYVEISCCPQERFLI